MLHHVMGTSVPPPAPRVCAPDIAAVAADPILMIAAMVGVAKITGEQDDADDKKLEDYGVSIARASSLIVHHTEQKDMISVIEIHRFGAVYSEVAIQGMPESDEVQARVLMTYPSNRWRQDVDNIAIRSLAPTVAEIFAGWRRRGNRGFGGGGHRHQHQQQPLRQKFRAKAAGMSTSVCYCCGKTGRYANKCSIRLTALCSLCKVEGHILTACKRKNNNGGGLGKGARGAGGAGGQGGSAD